MNLHVPVLAKEIEEILMKNHQGTAFEGTFGGGGHTALFLQNNFQIFTCDLDFEAIKNGKIRFQKELENGKIEFLNKSFDEAILDFENKKFDVILVDLGYSSNQLENSKRGFSYQKDEEDFDLRYDDERGVPAFKLIQEAKNEAVISKIIFNNSGETFARKIAFELFQKRSQIQTVESVKNVVLGAIPKSFLNKKNAVLSRVWQAFRIEINNEFEILNNFLKTAPEKLKVGGKLAIICFHSLEDKMVTKYFRDLAKTRIIDDFGNKKQDFKLVSKKAILPSSEEIEKNVRSRSATLRILEKL